MLFTAFVIGETAEMPGMYSSGEYDVAGFAVGAVERDKVLPKSQTITPDDVVIGLASSGIHSNGFSLVRRIIDDCGLSYTSPSPFTTTEGLQSVTRLGEALLTPTRIYCRSVLPLMHSGKIKAFAHITGSICSCQFFLLFWNVFCFICIIEAILHYCYYEHIWDQTLVLVAKKVAH